MLCKTGQLRSTLSVSNGLMKVPYEDRGLTPGSCLHDVAHSTLGLGHICEKDL